jgi:hypothetical protein
LIPTAIWAILPDSDVSSLPPTGHCRTAYIDSSPD